MPLSPDSPFLLGFEELGDLLRQMTKSAEGFPPYNIEQLETGALRITLAVAGYAEADLDIMHEDNRLIIRGRQEPGERRYLHRGIAGRSFIKTFVLADGMKVQGAHLENGLLNVDVLRPERTGKAKRIAIKTDSTRRMITAK